MKRFGLLGTAILLCAATVQTASAFSFTTCTATGSTGPTQAMCNTAYGPGIVSVTGGIQSWTVPQTGIYRVTAIGAQGASADPSFVGGRGAQISGLFTLTGGQSLQLVVGQIGSGQNSNENGGGGGGSFVVTSTNTPLLVAGGGGGTRHSASQNGCDASVTEFAVTGSGGLPTSSCALETMDLGLGGIVSSPSWGSAGAGFNGDGASDNTDDCGITTGGGLDWAHGMLGGNAANGGLFVGGFGGGGDGSGCSGGGGGGGYSGGDGGWIAGGGGSFNSGSSQSAVAGAGVGDGSISIDLVTSIGTIPTLSPWGLMLLVGLMLVATLGVRRRLR